MNADHYPDGVSQGERDSERQSLRNCDDEDRDADDEELEVPLEVADVPRLVVDGKCLDGEAQYENEHSKNGHDHTCIIHELTGIIYWRVCDIGADLPAAVGADVPIGKGSMGTCAQRNNCQKHKMHTLWSIDSQENE